MSSVSGFMSMNVTGNTFARNRYLDRHTFGSAQKSDHQYTFQSLYHKSANVRYGCWKLSIGTNGRTEVKAMLVPALNIQRTYRSGFIHWIINCWSRGVQNVLQKVNARNWHSENASTGQWESNISDLSDGPLSQCMNYRGTHIIMEYVGELIVIKEFNRKFKQSLTISDRCAKFISWGGYMEFANATRFMRTQLRFAKEQLVQGTGSHTVYFWCEL